MPHTIAIALGELKERVAALERDMAMIKRLAGRTLLLASIWGASVFGLTNAGSLSDLLAALLKRLIVP